MEPSSPLLLALLPLPPVSSELPPTEVSFRVSTAHTSIHYIYVLSSHSPLSQATLGFLEVSLRLQEFVSLFIPLIRPLFRKLIYSPTIQTVELRTSKPIKATWLKISLFKVEKLPQQGQLRLPSTPASRYLSPLTSFVRIHIYLRCQLREELPIRRMSTDL